MAAAGPGARASGGENSEHEEGDPDDISDGELSLIIDAAPTRNVRRRTIARRNTRMGELVEGTDVRSADHANVIIGVAQLAAAEPGGLASALLGGNKLAFFE